MGPQPGGPSRARRSFEFDNFETMLIYDQALTDAVIDAASRLLARPRDTVLEIWGSISCRIPMCNPCGDCCVLGGVTYADFLHSLEDLPGRARLALPDIDLPQLDLVDHNASDFTLICHSRLEGAGHVVVGILRAMADDYGALSLVEHLGPRDGGEAISITVAETAYPRAAL